MKFMYLIKESAANSDAGRSLLMKFARAKDGEIIRLTYEEMRIVKDDMEVIPLGDITDLEGKNDLNTLLGD